MKIVFLKENKRENRITLLPNSLKELPKDFHIFFESGIGHKLGYKDSEYVSCGYTKCSNKDISDADIIIKLSPLTIHQQKLIKDPKQILITNTYLANNTMYLKQLLDNHIASIGIELFHENNVYP
jgi:alanine dehydrogenase